MRATGSPRSVPTLRTPYSRPGCFATGRLIGVGAEAKLLRLPGAKRGTISIVTGVNLRPGFGVEEKCSVCAT